MSAFVHGVGLVTPLALGQQAFVDAWRAGASAESVAEGAQAGGARVPPFKLRDHFPKHKAMLRRMDRLSKLICLGAALARDEVPIGDPDRTALAVGTDLGTLEGTWAFLTRLRDKGAALANPADFPNLVPNAGAGYAGIFLGLRGPSHTFCQHELCGDEAVAWAASGLLAGRFDAAYAGGAEELGDVRALASRAADCGGPRPGEGAAMLALSRSPDGALARIVGSWACSAPGASPLRSFPPSDAARRLVVHSLERAGVAPEQVGALLLSDPALAAPVRAALGFEVPCTDHAARFGQHPADGATRVALASLLLADPTLPVHAGAQDRRGDVALVLSSARGGGLRLTLLAACASPGVP